MKKLPIIKIGWLYPSLMSTYGDRGNIITLTKRLMWRGIDCEVIVIDQDDSLKKVSDVHLMMMGGAQDVQQEIVMEQMKREGHVLIDRLKDGCPGLFVCGAYQHMGEYYQTADGVRIEALGYFPIETISYADRPRLIGNISIQSDVAGLGGEVIVGFENHGGRTHMTRDDLTPFGRVLRGFGNNGEDETEGLVFGHAIGTYLHGPLLPKNPRIADWLLKRALLYATGEDISLPLIPPLCEDAAREYVLNNRLK